MKFPVLTVSPSLYRSPQPRAEDLESLKKNGLKTIINLREESAESEFLAKELGLNYRYFSIVDWTTPTFEQVEEFLEIVDDSAQTPALVHCLAGVGRTGIMVSCYRISLGMPAREAIALSDLETPEIGMSQAQKDFVQDFEVYYQQKNSQS